MSEYRNLSIGTLGNLFREINRIFVFFQIEALDADKGSGGIVRYELAKAEKLFNINPFTGELRVGMDLSRFG